MKVLQEYVPELVSGAITLTFGVIFLIFRKNESDGYIVLAIGAQLTAALSLLKSEIVNKSNEKLNRLENRFDEKLGQVELFELFIKIRPELQGEGKRVIRDCKTTLRKLSEGVIETNAASIFNMLSDHINSSKHEVLAVHIGMTLDNFNVWERDYMQNYYEASRDALKRKVNIQRIFILSQEIILDPQTRKVNAVALRIMQQQAKDGVKVFIVHADNVTNPEDFAVIDGKLVEYGSYVTLNSKNIKSKLSFNPDDIETYHRKFNELKNRTSSLERWRQNHT